MRRFFQIFSYVTYMAAFFLMCLIFYWWFYPYNPISYKDEVYPILNENKIATMGGTLIYQVNYCKYTNIIPTITKRYVDGIIYDTLPSKGIVVSNTCGSTTVYNSIPDTLLPGSYHMDLVVDYQMNPIRHIIVHRQTEQFTIVKK
jgi:hypothetical protein